MGTLKLVKLSMYKYVGLLALAMRGTKSLNTLIYGSYTLSLQKSLSS